MATEAPPPYQEDLARLGNNLTPEKRAAILKAMTEHYKSSGGAKDLVNEVNDVANSAAKVDELFIKIRTDLGQLEYKDVNYKTIWDGYYTEYTNLMKVSSKTATEALDYLDEFTELVLPAIEAVKGPDDVDGRTHAIDKLQKFLHKVKKDQGKEEIDLENLEKLAKEQGEEYRKLQLKLVDFIGDFELFAQKRVGELSGEIATVTQKLKDLRDELSKINNKVTALAVALGITVFAGITAVWLGCAFLGPIGFIAAGILALVAVGEAAAFGVALKELSDKQKEVDLEDIKLKGLQSQQETLNRVRTSISGSGGDVLTISQKIDQIGKVWLSVAVESHRLQKELDRFSKSDPKDFEDFKDNVTFTKQLYAAVRDGVLAFVKHEAIPAPEK